LRFPGNPAGDPPAILPKCPRCSPARSTLAASASAQVPAGWGSRGSHRDEAGWSRASRRVRGSCRACAEVKASTSDRRKQAGGEFGSPRPGPGRRTGEWPNRRRRLGAPGRPGRLDQEPRSAPGNPCASPGAALRVPASRPSGAVAGCNSRSSVGLPRAPPRQTAASPPRQLDV
jgi:hypothetical protein